MRKAVVTAGFVLLTAQIVTRFLEIVVATFNTRSSQHLESVYCDFRAKHAMYIVQSRSTETVT